MKQRITVEQFNELSERAFLKLESWARGRGYAPLPYRENGEWKGTFLSIGQMIEFIGLERLPYSVWETPYTTGGGFRDALWESVKEILND